MFSMHGAARHAVLGTGSCEAFATKFPLLWAIIEHDAERVAQLCDQGLLDAHAPGGLNPLHLCALLNFPSPIPRLVAAGVPLDAQLSHDYFSPPLAQWLRDARLGTDRWDGACRLRAGRTPLGVATSTHESSYEAVGAALLDAGTDVWELLRQPPHHFFYAAWLAPALAQCLAAGLLVVESAEQLGLLVRLTVVAAQAAEAVGHPSSAGRPCARAVAQATACWDILQLAEQQWRMKEGEEKLCLGLDDAVLALVLGVQQGHAELVSWVLRRHRAASTPGSWAHNSLKHTGAVGNPSDWLPPHSQGAVVAAQRGHSQVLELLLEAGAVISSALGHAVIRQSGGQPSLLASLLRWGPIPVDRRQPLLRQKYWTCPVLLLLQTNCEAQQVSTHRDCSCRSMLSCEGRAGKGALFSCEAKALLGSVRPNFSRGVQYIGRRSSFE